MENGIEWNQIIKLLDVLLLHIAQWLRLNMPKLYVWQVVHFKGNATRDFVLFFSVAVVLVAVINTSVTDK